MSVNEGVNYIYLWMGELLSIHLWMCLQLRAGHCILGCPMLSF